MKNPSFWEEEKTYLAETLTVLNTKIERMLSEIDSQRQNVLDLKSHYHHNLRDFDMVEYVDNYSKLDDLIDLANAQISHVRRLQQIKDKPYFGRIDFRVKKDSDEMQLYIGLESIDHAGKLYVIDWRAPVSELFYEAGKGEASYQAPDGKIEGEVLLKRQYDIEQGKLLNVYDIDLNIFDEFLQQLLAKTSGEQLHNIASTIQKEQNSIIRNLKDNVIVVQGYAGCGKTTIALHRVAYALYRLKNLTSANILLFSPNEAFLSHIQNVLPELGENNTRNATFPKFVRRFLKTEQLVESSDEFISRFMFLSAEEQEKVLEKLKFSNREKLQNWLRQVQHELAFTEGFEIEEREFNVGYLNELLANFKEAKFRERVRMVTEAVCNQFGVERPHYVEEVMEQIESKLNFPIKLSKLYNRFLTDSGFTSIELDSKINFEDAILMCVLKELSQELMLKMDVKHIVLDEAQDYPLLFIEFLMRVFKHANFSVFGDIFQKTMPGELHSLADICEFKFLRERPTFIELDKTYRSSEEIVEYASALIGSPRHNAFRLKNGHPVLEIPIAKDSKDVAGQVLELIRPQLAEKGSIGVISGDTETASVLFNGLKKELGEQVSFVKNATASATAKVQIIPVALCKGLEFGSVIVVKRGKLFQAQLKTNFEYIACTRAINKLAVLKEQ